MLAYNAVLAPHQSWLARKSFGLVAQLLPPRQVFVDLLCVDGTLEMAQSFIRDGAEIVDKITTIYEGKKLLQLVP